MSWTEQRDSTIWVAWDKMNPDADKDYTHLVKNGDELIGKIDTISDSTTYEGKKIIKMVLEDGKEVHILTQSRLLTKLGFNPKMPVTSNAKVGDKVKIVYHGRDKDSEGNPHLFDVFIDR